MIRFWRRQRDPDTTLFGVVRLDLEVVRHAPIDEVLSNLKREIQSLEEGLLCRIAEERGNHL